MTSLRGGFRRVSHKQRARALWIGEVLDREVPDPAIPLVHKTPFELLVAVLLSAQCTDVRVNQVMPQLLALGSTPEELVGVPVEAIEEVIRPCGLFRAKAKAIQGLSRLLVERHHGAVPRTLQALEELPGVGHKTASVVMVQGFGVPAFPVDTHIARCAKRWGLSPTDDVVDVEERLKVLFPKELWGKRHLQIILFARRCCPSRGHRVEDCSICSQLMER